MLSVIIPIGSLSRDEANLKKLLTSLERFQSLEIILVFDFDANLDNKDEFEHMMVEEGVKIVKTKVRNPNQARLAGFRAATSEHIIFCDSDDCFDLPVLNDIAKGLRASQAVCFFPFDQMNFETLENEESNKRVSYFNIIQSPGLWRTIIPRAILKNDFFIPTKMGEDVALLSCILLSSHEILFDDRKFYKYVQRVSGNLSSSKNPEEYLKTIYEFTRLMKKYVQTVELNSIIASGIYFSFVVSTLKWAKMENWKEVFTVIKRGITSNYRLGICIGVSLPLVFLVKLSMIRNVQ